MTNPRALPEGFSFMFPEGLKHEADMTREELRQVTQYLLEENERMREERRRPKRWWE